MDVNARGLMADSKFFESYSRFITEENRYETWAESVERVMATHRIKYKDRLQGNEKLEALFNVVQEAYTKKTILGSQRALQFGGEQLLRHEFRLYNCLGGHANNVNFFGEFFYLLLCGCGVGASVQKHHVSQLPMISPRTKQPKTHIVEDSIEGWAKSIDVLMSSFFIGGGKHPEYEGRRVFFDTSPVREKGAPISGGFKAPGPEPLIRCLSKVERLLTHIAEEGILRPIHVFDIGMYIADAVLSGGVRRAATIFLFSKDDNEMMTSKTGNWFEDNPQRARANISAVLLRDDTSKEEFDTLIANTKEYGEPGFVWVDDIEYCYNPCVTADTIIDTDEGPKRVNDLIGKSFTAIVNGERHSSTEKGFWRTGKKPVFEVKTKRGYSIKATENHEVLIDKKGERKWVSVKNLKTGDKFVINKNLDMKFEIDSKEFDRGWLLGEVIGDGCHNPEKYTSLVRFWGESAPEMAAMATTILKETCEGGYKTFSPRVFNNIHTVETVRLNKLCESFISSKEKDILPESIQNMSLSMICGLMRGWFDSDGTVLHTKMNNSRALRLSSTNLARLKIAQVLLTNIGIPSTIYVDRQVANRDVKHKNFIGYEYKAAHELHIGRDGIDRFEQVVGFYEPKKQAALHDLQSSKTKKTYRDLFLSEVVSVELVGEEDVYDCTIPTANCFSANGLIVHNCLEIGFYPIINIDGVNHHGYQSCNLVEINGDVCDTEEKFLYACKMAAIMGTIQAGYTNFKFVSEATKKIIEREALLGVSLTGWLNHPDTLLNPETMKKGAKVVKETNEYVARLLGINQSARTTCVKPAGNASVLLRTASGVHPEHSKRYLRTVQMSKMQEVGQIIKDTNPYMVEESVWSADKSDYSIAFPVIAPKDSMFKKDLNALKFLNIIKSIQVNWVWEGTNVDLCADPKKLLKHNVSNTVHVLPDEWDDVSQFIYDNRDYFTGVSLLSATGEKDYHQAPYQEVKTETELAKLYGPAAMFASGLIVDATNGFDNLWQACSVAMNPNSDTSNQETKDTRSDWVRRFNKFAMVHFGGDLKKTSYCLKDVYLLWKWVKIQSNFADPKLEDQLKIAKSVDAASMGAIACSGVNGCEF